MKLVSNTFVLVAGTLSVAAAAQQLVACTGNKFSGCSATRTCPGTGTGGSAGEAGSDGSDNSLGSGNDSTTGSGDSSGGSSGATGDNQTDATSAAPSVGTPCDEPGKLACAGSAQKVKLVCDNGEWQNNGSCGAGENCEQASGVCAPIDEHCEDLSAGDHYCDENTVRECGPDFVNSQAVESCSAACRVFEGLAQCVRVTQIAAGRHTCAVLNTGQLKCWGGNTSGELGLGHTNTIGDEPNEMPPPDVPLGEKVKHVAVGGVGAGGSHTCAVLENGAVRCWGQNQFGQLGLGHVKSIGDDELPTQNVPLEGRAVEVALGQWHSCARLESGSVQCWGIGSAAGLGTHENVGDDANDTIGIVPLGGKAGRIAAGTAHTCALLAETGAVRCWGGNVWGETGVPPDVDAVNRPVGGDVDLGGPATHVGLGDEISCAVVDLGGSASGSVRCWGDGTGYRLGLGNDEPISAAGDMPPGSVSLGSTGENARQVDASLSHTCALMTSGSVKCWGSAPAGGYATTGFVGDSSAEFPPPSVELSGQAEAISVALFGNTCAILTDGTLQCWGANNLGGLGLGHTEYIGDDETPADAGLIPVF